MKNYKEFSREYLGDSDIACLILAGYSEKNKGLKLQELKFGGDGSYRAYIIDEPDVEIGNHYTKVAEFDTWLKIYDDAELVKVLYAKHINVYRAAEMGCIIQLVD